MAYTNIDLPAEYFNTVLWTGTGSAMSITGVGFQPDWVWYKGRSFAYNHGLFDVVRGTSNFLKSNSADAEAVVSGVTAFNSDGFSLGADAGGVGSGVTFVGWNWKANGAGVSNSDGTITSTVSANTDAGFSIVSYTGNSTSGATVGHGLGVAPKVVFGKARNTAGEDWFFGTSSIGFTKFLKLNTTDAENTFSGAFNNTAPSSTVVTLGNNGIVNSSSFNYIMYCFAEKKGFSKMGSYIANGSSDGNFIYTGFTPAFILTKCSSTDNGSTFWCIFDNKREGYNGANDRIFPNVSNAESNDSPSEMDILSNGFKIRGVSSSHNISGETFIYMAFASQPFTTSTGVPATAR